ncbi:hypothetical protein [Streptomyces sp. NPDC059788]|uniref:hypothetical protein n=1 Tax=Streptomyces sp. NPDC059788 TaxID=3346948 RepID=UPI0036648FE2
MAIRVVASGDTPLSSRATHVLVARFLSAPEQAAAAGPVGLDDVATRERQVMALAAAESLSYAEIAGGPVVGPLTVRTPIHRTMTKPHTRNRTRLVAVTYGCGLAGTTPGT